MEAALVAAASEYGIAPEEVNYRVIEKKHGFLKVRRNTVIEVDPNQPKKEAGEPEELSLPTRTGPMPPPPKAKEEEEETEETEEEVSAEHEPAEEDVGERPEDEVVEALEAEEDEMEERVAGEAVEPTTSRPALRPRQRGDLSRSRAAEIEEERKAQEEEGRLRAAEELGGEEKDKKKERRKKAPVQRKGREKREERGAERQRPAERAETDAPKRMPEPEPEPIEKRQDKAEGELADAAYEATEWLLDLVDLDVDPEVYTGEDRLEVELRGPDREFLVEDNGKILSAMEHLIPRAMRGICGDSCAIRVDSENFQEKREERLRLEASRLAAKVRREGQPAVMEAMDPGDRRIVHIALSDDPEVTTRSLGDGYFKRVKILSR